MSNIDIIHAWKDEEYRNSLTEEQRHQLPENPVGAIELSDDEMQAVVGGAFVYPYPKWIPREFFAPPSTKFLTGCDVFPNG